MKDQKPKGRNRAESKASSTETGRVAGQLGGLYTEVKPSGKKGPAEKAPAKRDKTPARPPEHG